MRREFQPSAEVPEHLIAGKVPSRDNRHPLGAGMPAWAFGPKLDSVCPCLTCLRSECLCSLPVTGGPLSSHGDVSWALFASGDVGVRWIDCLWPEICLDNLGIRRGFGRALLDRGFRQSPSMGGPVERGVICLCFAEATQGVRSWL